MLYLAPNLVFRRSRTANDNLAILLADVYKAFANRQLVPSLFLDIKGVFDNVDPFILLRNLQELRIPGGPWISSLSSSVLEEFHVTSTGPFSPTDWSIEAYLRGLLLAPCSSLPISARHLITLILKYDRYNSLMT